jgi:uncharacterized protein (DUF342 family)
MNIPGIELSEADSKVLLVAQPTAGRAPVDAGMLRTLLAERGYGNCALDAAAIDKAASMCNSQTEPLGLQVAQRLDAQVSVQLAPDDMGATVTLTAAQGGVAVNVADVMQALAQAGVVFGIDQERIAQMCAAARSTEQTVAKGTPARDGVDVRFEALIAKVVDRAPKLDSQGHIDYREHGVIAVVQAGVPLMRRIPAVAGVHGQTVKGRVVTARNGRDAPFSNKIKGAEISHDDPNLLVALVSGQPVLASDGVDVEGVLRVKEVNMASGNIHFDGSVHVTGDVVQGMKVEASGDIVVDGLVDGGHLDAGGNVTVTGGVIGHGSLHAAGAVHVRFAEGSTLVAGTLVAVSDMVIDSHLESIQQILIGTGSPQRGRMVGGSATAGSLMRVPWLGTANSVLAKVTLGVNPVLDAKLADVIHHIDAEKASEAGLEKLARQLKSTGDPKHLLDKVKASRMHVVEEWGKSLSEKADIEKEIAKERSARLEVTAGVEGAVDLAIFKAHARLRREFGPGSFTLNGDDKVVYCGPEGSKPEILH